MFELKFGPYLPAIDGEDGVGSPYEMTFGGDASLMTQLELDRFFLWPGGQLGAGFSAGYLQDSAEACAQNPDGTPDCATAPRPGDGTTFHLIPTALTAVYRFTDLADRTYVPLVPYVKLGLAYYIWWITKGDGDVTSTPMNGRARGGTLGWQGSLGVSVRADRIDPAAARNLETEFGVEHAGFFAELTWADVSGLGAGHKLHVGDLTWFAGINFEF